MKKALFLAAALALAPWPALSEEVPGSQGRASQSNAVETPSYASETSERGQGGGDLLDRLAQSELKDRLASAIESVEDACGDDIERYCGDVTPGEGRVALCMQAYTNRLSRRCRFTLLRHARNIRNTVENIADECWNGIKAQCGNAQNMGECAVQKSASLSPTCQKVVSALHHVAQAAAHLRDMPVYSSDGKDLGRVVEANRGPDGKVQSVQIQIGRFLGLGDKVVTIDAGQIQELADQIKLRLNSDQVRSLPEAKKAGG